MSDQSWWKRFYGTTDVSDAMRGKMRQLQLPKIVGETWVYGQEAAELRRADERERGHPSCKLLIDGDLICGGLILGDTCEKCGNKEPT
jgi:hypothetical protein